MTHEFYSPFFHLPGRYEWCTIHAERYGSFDCFIVIETTTDRPVTVYLTAESGARFMRDRFPESHTVQVAGDALRINAHDRRRASGFLEADSGPVRLAQMEFTVAADATPTATAYGGEEFAVWGSRFFCEGVDMELPAIVTGRVVPEKGPVTAFTGEAGVLTVGSYGALRSRRPSSLTPSRQ